MAGNKLRANMPKSVRCVEREKDESISESEGEVDIAGEVSAIVLSFLNEACRLE